MTIRHEIRAACAAALAAPGLACAQDVAPVAGPDQIYLAESASPFGAPAVSPGDEARLSMPKLAFAETPEIAADFDKYYYFYRPGTDFATAYADVRECDGYARGLASGVTYQQVPYPYAGTLGGALGGAIGNVMVAAIFGSAEKRRIRRVNMRSCMHFKGYGRYGLAKDLWESFNFEEGLSGVKEAERDAALKTQALVAATATPAGKELGL